MEVIIVGGKGNPRAFKIVDDCKGVKADVIIDLKGGCKDANARLVVTVDPRGIAEHVEKGVRRVLIGGAPLKTLVGLGVLSGNRVFAYDESGKAVGVVCKGIGVLYARPLFIYLVHYPNVVLGELKLILSQITGSYDVDLKRIIDEIVNVVVDERRSRRVSKTLALLEMALEEGVTHEFPAYIIDLLEKAGVIENGRINRELLARIIEEVKARVYPSSHA